MYIVNNNNCWFTNVGEAFIDIGVKSIIHSISERHDEIKYGTISPMSKYYISRIQSCSESKNEMNSFNPAEWIIPDIYIIPGMYGTENFAESYTLDMARNIKSKGGKVAFLGFGACDYGLKERNTVLRIMKELNPLFVITRDNKTYELYKDYIECIKGLDCAFWINKDFTPQGASTKSYTVSTFNRSDEPKDVASMQNLIHPWHMQYLLDEKKTRYLKKSNLMISDNPYDYITLYANADKTYTDLVHATIACLVYGTPVKYYQVDNRRDAFESLEYLAYDSAGFMTLNAIKLCQEKCRIEEYVENKIVQIMK